jgi:3-hydroxyacyl-CoA dehydrogenase
MNYADRLENVAVLGAAGKMGSGIVLLTAMEMADLKLESGPAAKDYVLQAIDVSPQGLSGLLKYLRDQVLRAAEKKVSGLRKAYEGRQELVENEDVVRQYVEDVLSLVRPTTQIEAAYDAGIVFEAVSENPELKVKLLSQIKAHNTKNALFLTNTSSIPISELNDKVKLDGRIIGFHFYNPRPSKSSSRSSGPKPRSPTWPISRRSSPRSCARRSCPRTTWPGSSGTATL